MKRGVWIPEQILHDDRLTATEKIILSVIISLDQSQDGCWASNKYIAKHCHCSVSKVSAAVSKMLKRGYLKAVRFDGRKRFLKCILPDFRRQNNKKENSASQKSEPNYNNDFNTNKKDKPIYPGSSTGFFAGTMERPPISEKDLMKELAGRNGNLV